MDSGLWFGRVGLLHDPHPPLLAASKFGREEPVEEDVRTDLVTHRLANHVIESICGMSTSKLTQLLAGGIDIEPDPGRSSGHLHKARIEVERAVLDTSACNLLQFAAHPTQGQRRSYPGRGQ